MSLSGVDAGKDKSEDRQKELEDAFQKLANSIKGIIDLYHATNPNAKKRKESIAESGSSVAPAPATASSS